MIGLTLSVNYLESDAYGGLCLRASGSLGVMKLAIIDYSLLNPDNSCVGAARRRHCTYLQLPF
ncbi:hypothetical protein [Nostoc sp. UHCC 0252]|uniref:hypothetical protein n=1 Tax=Nostoc sp. UHCC 0252 TaxID=3110241 RepID=UPI002B21562C|nr:hypothetical protein [Nostoc sp. UHCC 0252]MEA5599895.1 hypothetical protein [Nostoc sp. UHCC 0252]